MNKERAKELLETELKCISRKTRKEVTMTNRDYLRSLSNKKLAELLEKSDICNYLIGTCPDGNCKKCITNWLRAERKPRKENDESNGT